MVSCTVVIRDDLTTDEVRGYVERIGRVFRVVDVVEAGRYPEVGNGADLYVAIGGDGTDGYDALNDVTVNTTAARMIEVSFTVDGQRPITFRGDGLIVATPTGSTAYNLAAGGPIVLPDIPAFIITPLAPHSLSLRSVVVSSRYDIRVRVRFRHESLPLLSADGIPIRHLKNGEELSLKAFSNSSLYPWKDLIYQRGTVVGQGIPFQNHDSPIPQPFL